MADEAFALSPISARATLPSEADYDAISEAFMETSRGRWFLSEYAKRNRNADTRMVLDAVARIEESIAAQKQPAPDSKLPEALAAIKGALNEARAIASEALDGRALEDSLAPVRKGARVIREIAWRLREIGADGRICDLLDSQVGTIEAGCGQLAATDPGAALIAAFELIESRIQGLASAEAPIKAEVASAPATATPSDDIPPAPETEAIDAETAYDDALLDTIAFEMAAPDFSEPEIFEAPDEEATTPAPELVAEVARPSMTPEPVPRPPLPASQVSLGASLIADGIVRRPVSDSGPLAPIRRMSQAEKIAFFS